MRSCAYERSTSRGTPDTKRRCRARLESRLWNVVAACRADPVEAEREPFQRHLDLCYRSSQRPGGRCRRDPLDRFSGPLADPLPETDGRAFDRRSGDPVEFPAQLDQSILEPFLDIAFGAGWIHQANLLTM